MKVPYLLYPDPALDLASYELIDKESLKQEFKQSYSLAAFTFIDCFFIDALRETLENSSLISLCTEKKIKQIEQRCMKVRESSGYLQDKIVEIEHKKKILCYDEEGFKLNCKKIAEHFVYQFKLGDLSESEFITLLKESDSELAYDQYVRPTLTQLSRFIEAQKRKDEPLVLLADPEKESEWGDRLWIRL